MKICPQCSELYPDDAGFCPLDGSRLGARADPFLGRTVAARYRLVKKLGAGGMSVVYLARHVMIERLNALKILRADLTLDPNHRERFLREARAANRINHPNIIEITDFGEEAGLAYLVMEYAPGESLLEAIRRGALRWERAVRIGVQVSSALARAHQAGIIHRDLKPENVLLLPPEEDGDEERVKLTDFGIAKILDAPALTFSEQLFGTPGYIAPEIVEGAPADARTDLFALGVMLFEMTSGALPFDAKGQAELLLKPLTAKPTPLRARAPEVPAELEQLVTRMLAREPKDRPQDAFEVLDTLSGLARRAKAAGRASVPAHAQVRREALDTVADAPASENALGAHESDDAPRSHPLTTANLGLVHTSEIGQRWLAAHAEVVGAIARARLKGRPADVLARAEALAEHARALALSVERASLQVAEAQKRVDQLEARAREFRGRLGRAIDELSRDRSRERLNARSLQARADEVERSPPSSSAGAEARVWESATLRAEAERARAAEEDLTFQIAELEKRLHAENEAHAREYAIATGALEGAIAAVRAMTSELVRTLDEAAALASARRR
jgi:serine/threonine-protein kinase